MKNFSLVLVLLLSVTLNAQDLLKTELFEVDVVMKYQSQIELTENQRESIKKIHSTHLADFNSAKWDLDAEMVTLNTFLVASKVNETEALQQMKIVTDLETQLKMTRLEMLVQVKNKLSEVQQTKLKELRTESDVKPTSFVTTINDGQKIKLQVSKSKNSKLDPLYVIIDNNGERQVNKLSVNTLDADNIESVNVLKGASAKKAYGKNGENGVVVIKLKQH